jgi:hypothetical protein
MSQWYEFFPHFRWTKQKLAGLDEHHLPAIPCHENVQTTERLAHDSGSYHCTHFSGLGVLPWQFSPIHSKI